MIKTPDSHTAVYDVVGVVTDLYGVADLVV